MVKILENIEDELKILKQFLDDNGYRNIYRDVYKKDDGTESDLNRIIKKLKGLDFKTADYVEYTSGDSDYDLYKFTPKYDECNVYIGYRYVDDGVVVAINEPTSIFMYAGID